VPEHLDDRETFGLDSHGAARDPHKKKRHWWIWLVVIAVLIAGYIYYQRRAANSAASNVPVARPVPIQTVAARKGDIGVYINALGTVTPVYTVTVTARVQGEILNVYYKEGQIVRKGDPLLDIDARPYQAALTQAEGQLAHDQAVLNKDKIDLDRYQLAYNRNAIAKQQLDDQQQTVFQDDGTVKNDQGAVANANVNLVYTHITSPIDGRVGLRLVDPGNMVQANSTTPLVVVTQLEPITVIFSIAEDYLPQIQKQLKNGQRMEVDAFDRDQQTQIATGSLLTLDNIIDTTTGTVKLKAIFPNKDYALFPNQFVNARLTVDTLRDATLVPTATIQRNAQGAFVYLISSGQTAAIHTITQGATDGDTAAVTGINPGDVVALSGFDKLQDGAQVAVRNKSGASGASGANPAGASGATGASGSSGPSGPSGATRGKKSK
jgi:multidrug efflux system membrane fusion protein